MMNSQKSNKKDKPRTKSAKKASGKKIAFVRQNSAVSDQIDELDPVQVFIRQNLPKPRIKGQILGTVDEVPSSQGSLDDEGSSADDADSVGADSDN